jgi:hypothetical protein
MATTHWTSLSPMSPIINDNTPCNWKLPNANQAVWTFVSNFWILKDSAQVDYIKKCQTDNDSKGYKLWLYHFHTKWSD